ncbi:hypothetical protein [Caballeronia sp. LZ035]|uniref:hypothetical protein n=1 Tax=Caballeronia sp. LZ035 TaxID=3038568 RepID=UPI002856419D|nr:hypothetical protein [Caballeronia sp. LZ035]MDR5762259.1 hypothetical protein [Caballeronia sp. LZ035]
MRDSTDGRWLEQRACPSVHHGVPEADGLDEIAAQFVKDERSFIEFDDNWRHATD